jgi:hypothetical protein
MVPTLPALPSTTMMRTEPSFDRGFDIAMVGDSGGHDSVVGGLLERHSQGFSAYLGILRGLIAHGDEYRRLSVQPPFSWRHAKAGKPMYSLTAASGSEGPDIFMRRHGVASSAVPGIVTEPIRPEFSSTTSTRSDAMPGRIWTTHSNGTPLDRRFW